MTVFTLIDFSLNRLEGPIPDTLRNLKALHILNLLHNAFCGPIPPLFGELQQLESLNLPYNYINGKIPLQLSDLNFFQVLNLSYNQLVGAIPTRKKFPTLSKSSFEGNKGLCWLPLNKSCLTNLEEPNGVYNFYIW